MCIIYIIYYVYLYHVYPSHFLTELLGPGPCVGRSFQRRRVWCTDDRGAGPASPYAPKKTTSEDIWRPVYGCLWGILWNSNIFLISYYDDIYDDIYDPYILILFSVMSMISMFSMSSVSTSTRI